MSFLQLFLVLIILLIYLLFLLFSPPLIKPVFGNLTRPSRSPLDTQELDVANNIKMKAVHEFKRNVTVEEALQVWENCTQCKIRYGDNYKQLLGKT